MAGLFQCGFLEPRQALPQSTLDLSHSGTVTELSRSRRRDITLAPAPAGHFANVSLQLSIDLKPCTKA